MGTFLRAHVADEVTWLPRFGNTSNWRKNLSGKISAFDWFDPRYAHSARLYRTLQEKPA